MEKTQKFHQFWPLRHSLCKNHPLVQGSRVQGFFLCPIKSIGYWSLITESREKNSETSPLWSWGVGVSKNRIFRIDSDSNKTYTNRFLDPDLWSKVPKTTADDLRNPYLDQKNRFLTLKISQKRLYLLNYVVVFSNFLHKHRSKRAWYVGIKNKKFWGPPRILFLTWT